MLGKRWINYEEEFLICIWNFILFLFLKNNVKVKKKKKDLFFIEGKFIKDCNYIV